MGLQGLQDMICVMWSLLNVWIPFIVLTFTSTSTVSCGNRHLKYPCTRLHSDIKMQAIWKIIYIVLYSSLFALSYIDCCLLSYTVSCVLKVKVNHVIPCLSITWKSSGSLFNMHLILIFSLSLIVTILGKLILLSLKVTLTSFQCYDLIS